MPTFAPAARVALSLLFAAALCAASRGGDEHPRYGKSYAQILAMGDQRWLKYHASKAGGDSTVEISEAWVVYRDALRWRNDRLAGAAPAVVRRNAAELRPLLDDYVNAMMDVGRYNTGGGTIWANIGASAHADVEETLYRLLGGPGKPPPPLRTSRVSLALDHLRQTVDRSRKDFPPSKEEREGVLSSLSEGRDLFGKIVKIAARFDRRGSDEILGFCLAQARQGEGNIGPG